MDLINKTSQEEASGRSLKGAMLRGFMCKCPSCGKAGLFDGLVSVKKQCEACDEDLSHEMADDFPAYLNVLIVGHVLIGFAMGMMKYNFFDIWTTTFLTIIVCAVVSLGLMRPLKGLVVGSQWALGMHGFEAGKELAEQN